MAWREIDEIKVWRNEGGNGVEAYVARVTDDRYAWNVRRHGSVLAYGYSRTLEGAQGESERRLIEAERRYTDQDDRRRDCATEHRVRGFEREVRGRRERVRSHVARNPRRR
jgi:hypothetical protein